MTLVVRDSGISGLGVFTDASIAAGSVIWTLSGERISLVESTLRVLTGRLTVDNPLMVGPYSYIHLDDFSVRFNHSCDPNAGLRAESELFAHRDIAAGEEITYDYSLTVVPTPVTWFWRMGCRCGAATCRGTIGNVRHVPADHVKALRERGELQTFIADWASRHGR